jgi:predicted nucleic acid-binding protein
MKITGDTTLFFDASVLVAGAHSEEGGSALLLDACELSGFTAQVTSLVVLEANHVLERDFPPRSLARFYNYLAQIEWEVLPVPPGETLQEYGSMIDQKDLHVLAAAAEGKSEFLLTLDRKHVLSAANAVEKADLPIRILTPGDFIRRYYPLHEAYPSLPPRRNT